MPFFLPCNGRHELRQSLAAAEGEIRSLQDRARALEAELAGARRRPDAGGGAAECGGAADGVKRGRPPSPERDTQTNITACEDETPPRETSTGDPSTQQHKALQAEVASLTDGVRGLMVALDQMTTLNNELIEEKAALEATLLERDAGTSCASNSAPASTDGGSEGAKKWAGLVLGEKVRFAPGTLPSPSEQTTSVENGGAFPLSPLSEWTASTFDEGDIKKPQANMAARNKQLEATVASLSARNEKLEAQLAKEKERSARRRAAAKERRRKLKHRLADMSKKLREDLGDSLDVDSSLELFESENGEKHRITPTTNAITSEQIDLADANYFASWQTIVSAAPSSEVYDNYDGEDGLRIVSSGLQIKFFNVAFVTRALGDPSRALDKALRFFRERRLPGLVCVRDGVDLRLDAVVRRRGLRLEPDHPGMVLSPLPQEIPSHSCEGLEIATIETNAGIDEFARVAEAAFGMPTGVPRALTSLDTLRRPGVTYFLGRVDGRAVATSASIRTGKVAGIYWVTTDEAFRGRGIGTAMTWAAVRAGAAEGCDTACLQASALGQRVYERLGFKVVAPYNNYEVQAS